MTIFHKKKNLFSSILILLFIANEMATCMAESNMDCQCWDALDENMKTQINTAIEENNKKITNKNENVQSMPYSYWAGNFTNGTLTSPCLCDDVTRIRTTIKIKFNSSDDKMFNVTNLEEKILQKLVHAMQISNLSSNYKNVILKQASSSSVHVTNLTTLAWQLEVVAKGRSKSYPTEITSLTEKNLNEMAESASQDFLVDPLEDLTILKCLGAPVNPPGNATLLWSKSIKLAGEKAIYTCNNNFIMSGEKQNFSQCLHDNLTWSDPGEKMTCKPGCKGNMPKPPFFVLIDFDSNKEHVEEATAVYYCMIDYKSKIDVNGSTTCTNGEWTPLDETFQCDLIKCSRKIPQTPQYAFNNWDNVSVRASTVVRYSCLEERQVSDTQMDHYSKCRQNGTWSPISDNFTCVGIEGNIRVLLNNRKAKIQRFLKKPITLFNDDYLTTVTLPCFSVFAALVIMVFCVTRPNSSAIFFICKIGGRQTKYSQVA